jgi:hypothetical protein
MNHRKFEVAISPYRIVRILVGSQLRNRPVICGRFFFLGGYFDQV